MYNTHHRLVQLRAEIAMLRREIAGLEPDDIRRVELYRALLERYHESIMLHGRLSKLWSSE